MDSPGAQAFSATAGRRDSSVMPTASRVRGSPTDSMKAITSPSSSSGAFSSTSWTTVPKATMLPWGTRSHSSRAVVPL